MVDTEGEREDRLRGVVEYWSVIEDFCINLVGSVAVY